MSRLRSCIELLPGFAPTTRMYLPMLTRPEELRIRRMGLTDMKALVQYHKNVKKENWLKEYMHEWQIGMDYLNNYIKLTF